MFLLLVSIHIKEVPGVGVGMVSQYCHSSVYLSILVSLIYVDVLTLALCVFN